MADEGAEKTEQASERKLEKAREEGQVPSARELGAAVSIGAGLLGLIAALPALGESLVTLTRVAFRGAMIGELSAASVSTITLGVFATVGPPVLLALTPAMVTGIAVGLLTTQFNLTLDVLEPKPERLDPFAGFQKLISPDSLESIAKGLIACGIVGGAAVSVANAHSSWLPAAAGLTAGSQLRSMLALAEALAWRLVPAAAAMGAADYLFQHWRLAQRMMMTRQEVKEENKDSEGDPQLRAQRKRRARQLAMGSLSRDVAKADVIVTNPTHYAVALRYRPKESSAPIIVARGVDAVALRIRSLAMKSDIAIIENRALARALYARGKVGHAIPADLYGPVARVLAVVFRRRRVTQPTS